jgi:hypothetical protein
VSIRQIIRDTLRYGWRIIRLTPLLLPLFFLLQYSTFPRNILWNAVAVTILDHQFDYLGWEVGAIGAKIDQTLYGLHPFMSEADRSQYVRDYMAQLAEARQIEAQIETIYTNPEIADPDTESAELRLQRDTLRTDLQTKQSLVEAIVEGQVAAVLTDAGFGMMGQLVPPISMRFTPIPNLLIVSPRDTIQMDVSVNLYPLPVDQKVAIEEQIDTQQDVSSLIVPLGGLALYPAMIVETTSIPFSVEVFAHEWLHHYLFLFPLGLNYDFVGEARLINETTAALFGKEVARLVLQRYYPDLLPPPPAPPATPELDTPPSTPEAPVFDFGAVMNETRITVDDLLAAGKVEEAERYMEAQRALFVANGYGIRKINQAYFAFYGGYQAGGIPGIGGEDPIGPAVRDLRQASLSLHDWVVTMRGITTREELLVIRDTLVVD